MIYPIFFSLLVPVLQIVGSDYTPTVETENGKIKGLVKHLKNGVQYHFYGIPYAEPPLGSLRFKKPRKGGKWSDTREAIRVPKSCLQPVFNMLYEDRPMSEDCLYLNILMRENPELNKSPEKRPVMVFIHGGALQDGSGTDFPYLSDVLVDHHDIILVTLSYRLNVFGFIQHNIYKEFVPNIGLFDQNMAIKWVKNNIAKFGGDDENITIFGQSAGAESVYSHLISPYTRGLFKRAILMSGQPLYLGNSGNLTNTLSANILLQRHGCEKSNSKIKCLQSIPAKYILGNLTGRSDEFYLIADDDYIPKIPIYDRDINILMGALPQDGAYLLPPTDTRVFTKPNLSYFDGLQILRRYFNDKAARKLSKHYFGPPERSNNAIIKKGAIEVSSDLIFYCPTFELANRYSSENKKAKTFAYILNRAPSTQRVSLCDLDKTIGVCHGDDLFYVFGAPFRKPYLFNDEDRKMSEKMMKIWTDFARKGFPITDDGEEWPFWKQFNYDLKSNSTDLSREPEERKLQTSPTAILDLNIRFQSPSRIAFCINEWAFLNDNLLPKLALTDPLPLKKQKNLDKMKSLKGFLSNQAFYTSYLYLAFKDDK
ncbi:acetylcholinesterase-1-like [Brevipalpus obovatus]|uniref:acetylcholinesterase-1-like n=1 Tax=Brevipalpus obovatus TaxID=246614 RepID=UPI003D9E5706